MPRAKPLVLVSNRLPVHRVTRGEAFGWESSAGGLVTALGPVLRERGGAWVGWSGAAGAAPKPFRHEGMRIRPVGLTRGEVEHYYQGMSNSTFWPLYHDAIRTPEFHRHWWRPYKAVNRKFAQATAGALPKGATAWVQDFHLQLVPRMLREARGDVKIGFFLHIPFPPEELFDWLPWREDILRGLLGADVVGFQTPESAQNFSRCARRLAGVQGTDSELLVEGRRVVVRAFPISIDSAWWESAASTPAADRRAAELRARVGPERRIMLAVDRLDYTKGINLRLRAFEELLRAGGASAKDCLMIQVAVPSREVVGDYATLRAQVEGSVGRIHGQFSEPGRVAMHYLRRNLTREEVAAYYRAADVMLVTPLRDGMNLVAKEYVACRASGDGVLVLSRFAGAARELGKALIINPRDLDEMGSSMQRALRMPTSEQRERMGALRRRVMRRTVFDWAGDFLEVLGS